MADWVLLPLVFARDAWPDYETIILALLGLISPEVPVNTQVVEWWDQANRRVLVRLTVYQGFHYTLTLTLNGAKVDNDGMIDSLNTMLTFMNEPGRFVVDDSRHVCYRELAESGMNEGWE